MTHHLDNGGQNVDLGTTCTDTVGTTPTVGPHRGPDYETFQGCEVLTDLSTKNNEQHLHLQDADGGLTEPGPLE